MKIERRHVRELAFVVAAHAGSAVALLVAVKVLTRALVPEEYGHVAIVTSYVVAAMTVLTAPITGAGMVEYHDAVRDGRALELTGTLFLASIVSMLLPFLGWVVLLIVGWTAGLSATPALIAGALLYLCAELLKTPVVTMTVTARRRGWFAMLMLVDAWGKIAVVLAAMRFIALSAEVVILSYAANSFLVAIAGWGQMLGPALRGAGRAFVSKGVLRAMFRSGWSFAGIGVAGWVINLSDRAILGFMVPAAAVGLYVAANQASAVVPGGLSTLITGTLNPILLQRQSASPADAATQFGRALLLTVWVILPASVIAMADPALLIRAIASRQYAVSASLLLWLVPAFACLAVTNTAAIAFWMSKRVKVYFAIAGGAGALNVILNLLLIPRLGIAAAAISTFATYLAQLIGTLIAGRLFIPWRLCARDLVPLFAGVLVLFISLMLLRGRVQPILNAFLGAALYGVVSAVLFFVLRRQSAPESR